MASRPKTIGDIMTRSVVTLLEEDNLDLLEEGMKKLKFRHVPVVDGRRLVGLVTERDLLRWSIKNPREREKLFVADVMNRDVFAARPSTSIAEGARFMKQHKVDCLPVTDGDGNLVGIVTTADYLTLVDSTYDAG